MRERGTRQIPLCRAAAIRLAVAAVRHIGLFPRSWGCPLTEEQLAAKFPEYYAQYGMTAYPLEMSKAAAVALYWKVRQWTIRVTASEGPDFQTVDLVFTSEVPSLSRLVCGNRDLSIEVKIVDQQGDVPETNVWGETSWVVHSNTPLVKGEAILPALSLSLYFIDDFSFGGGGTFAGGGLLGESFQYTPNTELELSFAGFRFGLPAHQTVNGGPGGVGSTIVEYIRATDYWDYS